MGISGRIARAFLQSQLTPLIALVALLLGTFAVIVTPKEEEPQINVTMANVFIPFPGASAKDVETLVATPAEQVLSQVQGLEHVYSVSRPGVAILTVQYKVGVGREAALVRLWDAIHANRDWVSAQLGVGEPIIKAKGIDDVPIVALTLSTADAERGAFDLERVAHAMEVELKRVPGTREVTSIGGPGRKVRVLLDADKLSAYNVSPLEIQNALQLSNVALPSGNLVSNNQQIEIQTGNWLENARDVANLVVGVSEGNPVYLSDIARIVDGPDQVLCGCLRQRTALQQRGDNILDLAVELLRLDRFMDKADFAGADGIDALCRLEVTGGLTGTDGAQHVGRNG